jgi:hypothetical protein
MVPSTELKRAVDSISNVEFPFVLIEPLACVLMISNQNSVSQLGPTISSKYLFHAGTPPSAPTTISLWFDSHTRVSPYALSNSSFHSVSFEAGVTANLFPSRSLPILIASILTLHATLNWLKPHLFCLSPNFLKSCTDARALSILVTTGTVINGHRLPSYWRLKPLFLWQKARHYTTTSLIKALTKCDSRQMCTNLAKIWFATAVRSRFVQDGQLARFMIQDDLS